MSPTGSSEGNSSVTVSASLSKETVASAEGGGQSCDHHMTIIRKQYKLLTRG